MIKIITILSFSLYFMLPVIAQKPPETESEFEKAYKRRIQKEYLNGVFIPKDLAEAFIQFNKLIDAESKSKFKSMPESQIDSKLFFSLGRWITHNWGFYGGSRFSNYLKNMGIFHPEDMARFTIIAYHRNLNRNPLDIKNLLATFHNKQKESKQKLIQEGTILHEETRQRAKPPLDSLPSGSH